MALLCATLGIAIAFAPRRAAWAGFAALLAAAAVTVLAPVPQSWRGLAFAGLWVSLVATALLPLVPRLRLRSAATLAAGANAGFWAGAVAASSGAPRDLALALPAALLFAPGLWLVARGHGIVLKLAAAWLLAIGALAGMVSLTPTPGYAPDHMD
jgi:hypothetical protein